ncbi:MAG: thymidine phosphorylase [Piscirickettsiaceae bacterium]|nr:MAG: thymidine phosphorylase [Piscirickettsiaceae bacterium]
MRPPNQKNANRAYVADHNTIAKVVCTALCDYLQSALPEHIKDAQERLYQSSETAGLEAVSIDLKVFNKSSNGLASLFLNEVKQSFTKLNSRPVKTPPKVVHDASKEDEFDGLSLLDKGEIEEQLTIDGCVYRSEQEYKDVLYALNKRLAVIFAVPSLTMSTNPVSPWFLMNQYADRVKTQLFSAKTKQLLFKSFEEKVLLGLADVYDSINKLCIQAGVMPKLPKRKAVNTDNVNGGVKSNLHEALGAGSIVAENSNVQNIPVSEIPAAIYAPLLEMAQAYRATAAASAISDGLIVAGEQFHTGELLNSLTELQKISAVEGANVTEGLRTRIGMQVQVGGQRRPYAEHDDTLIDVVAMLFDAILQDRQLPDVVRAMIAQLQIPILKVAMMDKEFFARKNHPARQFLNSLSHAGLGISDKNNKIRNVVFEKMEALVAEVLLNFESDMQIFSDLVEEFELFMAQQQRQIDVIEERAQKVTKSGEQLELTKRQAAYEIALRLKGTSIPVFVKGFLDDVWVDVLVLALLRREREPAALKLSLSVIERLVASVVQQKNTDKGQSILQGLPRLLKDIKVGLENISYDFHEAAPFFKDLEAWHRSVLTVKLEEDHDIPVVEEIVLIDTGANVCGVSLEDDLVQELEEQISTMPDDKYSTRVNEMAVGDWVEYESYEGEPLRAKLSWKSAVTLKCLFVDESGSKAMDISLIDLAEELRQKKMRVVGQEKAPLVERALSGMKKLIGANNQEFDLV